MTSEWVPLSVFLAQREHVFNKEHLHMKHDKTNGTRIYEYWNEDDGKTYIISSFDSKNGHRYANINNKGFYKNVKNLEEMDLGIEL